MEFLPNDLKNIIKDFIFFKPKTKKELKTAVNLWCGNKDEALQKYGNISLWDTSLITDMSNLFFWKPRFNGNVSKWDVSNVTNMNCMFYACEDFNQSLNNWNVSNVTDMSEMFRHCSLFNQSLNNWNVSNVKDMIDLFRDCKKFNQDLNDWNVDPDKTKMCNIFCDATIFPYYEKAKWYDWQTIDDDFSDY